MFAQILLLSMGLVGINVGWQPLPEGGMEYIIQLDPQSLEALKAGLPIQSDVPPSAGDVRSYKIILGTKKPQRISPPETSIESPPVNAGQSARQAHAEGGSSEKLSDKAAAGQTPPFPRKLLPDPTGKPLTARSAAFDEPAEGASKSEAARTNQSEAKNDEPAKPWMPLTLVLLGLFASLGGNVYLTWIFADLRRRYRVLLSQ